MVSAFGQDVRSVNYIHSATFSNKEVRSSSADNHNSVMLWSSPLRKARHSLILYVFSYKAEDQVFF